MQICVPAKRGQMLTLRQMDGWNLPSCVWLNMQMCVSDDISVKSGETAPCGSVGSTWWESSSRSHHGTHMEASCNMQTVVQTKQSATGCSACWLCVMCVSWKVFGTRSFWFGYLVCSGSIDPTPSLVRTDLVLFGRGWLMFLSFFFLKCFINFLFGLHGAIGTSRNLNKSQMMYCLSGMCVNGF